MKKYIDVFKQTFTEFSQDKAPRLGAALAYYTIFSIGPLLLIAVAMAGLFLGQEAAHGQISGELGRFFGPQMAKSLEDMIQAASKPKSGTLATIVGFVTLILGASGVFGQLKDALNTIWNVEPKKAGGIMGFIKERFLSMAMVLGIGFLLLVTLLLDTIIAAMGKFMEGRLPGGEAVLQAIQLVLSFGIAVVLFAAIFRVLPDLRIAWHDVWFGAVFTAILFVLGKFGLGLYLGKAAVGSAYGAAGSLVILLVWVYWSAQILFFGAEFTQVYARTFGSLKGDDSKRKARAQADKPEDRKKAETTPEGKPLPLGAPRPAYAKSPTNAKKSGGGGALKMVLGGVAGLLFGAIVGGVSAVVFVLKSLRKVFIPFK
ncbi:MAG: YihY/virulence factor BrkB family protein [Acidobacteria bacterium]|nr:YihY/virulence factor BrkB family protein [Acidobacteriota bacterium]MBV9475690.1 YihY/virulence factor BrkB family protein [Acidobacteriota bacterium]